MRNWVWSKVVKGLLRRRACTQILGVYVNAEGAIWPCVAQKRLLGQRKSLSVDPNGDKPSDIWRKSPYLQWVRRTYTGACPYKAPLSLIAPPGATHEPPAKDHSLRI